MPRARRLAVLGAAIAGYAALVRPRMLRWGATDEEVERPFPGADLVPGGERAATMATTIDAPPRAVWPWLVQMGCNRAGWYSWDHLDNGGVPSAEEIHPEWQDIEVGDRIPSTLGERTWFEVAALEPERFLALRASYDVAGHPFDPRGVRPAIYTDSVWSFQLLPLPGNRARLIVSGYGTGAPRLLQKAQVLIFWEPAHWIMQTRQFANLRRRAGRARDL